MKLAIAVLPFYFSCQGELNVKKGKALFEKNCQGCHQTSDQNLFTKKWKTKTDIHSLVNTISNGIKGTEMPALKSSLSIEEIHQISKFIISGLNDSLDFKARTEEKRWPNYQTQHLKIKVSEVFDGSDYATLSNIKVIWDLAFVDSSNIFFSERSGKLFLFNTKTKQLQPIKGTPQVFSNIQAGLLDVELHPNFKKNKLLFLSYINESESKHVLNVDRYSLDGDSLVFLNKLLQATSKDAYGVNYGSRLDFDTDTNIYITVGDRALPDNAQDLSSNLGKIHRLKPNGEIPEDNPFLNSLNAQPSIYCYGNRNPQGIYFDKETGLLWSVEHGPKGGDELNVIKSGANYGWPLATFGENYDGTEITKNTSLEGTIQPIFYWVPSIAPGDMIVYNGSAIPEWKDDVFVTGMRAKTIYRLRVNKNFEIIETENLFDVFCRIRAIEQGPDGNIYFSGEIFEKPGKIFRISK